MDIRWFTVAVVICSNAWLIVCHRDCPYKECDCDSGTIECVGLHLRAIPELVSGNFSGLADLNMEDNQITFIPAKSLPPSLVSITFYYNPIASIDDAAFDDSSTTLTSLEFSSTNLTRIPKAFGHLRSLKYLYISGANIGDWNDNIMNDNGLNMEVLTLENIGLITWPTCIQYFTKLTSLTITGGTISSIPDNALDHVANSLTTLYLQNNRLTIIPKALSNLTKLQMLYLQNNQIHNVSWFPRSNMLNTIYLNENAISDAVQLSVVLRPSSKTLISVDITDNRLTAIPDLSFMNTESLDLTHNKISDPLSGAVPAKLYVLDLAYNFLPSAPRILATSYFVTRVLLSFNSITELHASDFHSKTVSVDVSYNLITALTDTSFPKNSGITTLDLNNNPITHISSVALKNLPDLVELNLQSTKLTRLPLGLSFLAKLSTFDVSNTPSLVCTCMESSLAGWVMKMSTQQLHGDCGQVSIYYFFSTLSPFCPSRRYLHDH